MRHFNHSQPRATAVQRLPPRSAYRIEERADDSDDSLLAYWEILRRHKAILAACCAAGGLLGLLVSLPQTPLYRSRVSLEIQTLNENFMNRRTVDPTADNYSADTYMQTQIRLLQSSSLVERATRKLKAQGPPADKVEPGPFVRLGRMIAPGDADPFEEALAIAADSVSVRGSGMTRVVEVFCESTHPKIAADFANLLANEFIQNSLDVRSHVSQYTSDALARQLRDARAKLEQSEGLLLAKARELGLDLAGDNENPAHGELQQLQSELLRAQADRIEKQSRLELVKSNANGTLPEGFDDAGLREYRSRLADLQRQMAELDSSVTPAHPKVLRLAPQIAAVKASLDEERANILKRIQRDYDAAARREALLRRDYLARAERTSQQAVLAVQYRVAKREVDTNRQLYDSMLQKVKEADIAGVMHSPNARIVDEATPGQAPVKPNRNLSAALGAILGSFAGMALLQFRERSSRRFLTPGSLSDSLRVRQLGVIPSAVQLPASRLRLNPRESSALDTGANPTGIIKPDPWHRMDSQLADSFHFALASILFARGLNGDSQVLVITSPGSGEGKTLSSVNLALACTRAGPRVLLVDGNVRDAQLHRLFNLPQSAGMYELLMSDVPLSPQALGNQVHATAVPGLFVLQAGGVGGPVTPVLLSPRVPELMKAFRQEFDIVFIDAPALLHTYEARLFARHSDGTVLVTRAGQTTREEARFAIECLEDDGSPVIGTLLNDWKPTLKAA